jgi:large subunit ribosomal protein L19
MNRIIDEITREQLQPDRDNFKVGDGVRVHTRVREGDKERIQIFSGIVIARKGSGIHESFTVRRVAAGEGVERVFPVNSVNIDKIEVERESVPMKARLYYLRNRIGKAANKVREKRILEKLGQPVQEAPVAEAAQAPAQQPQK